MQLRTAKQMNSMVNGVRSVRMRANLQQVDAPEHFKLAFLAEVVQKVVIQLQSIGDYTVKHIYGCSRGAPHTALPQSTAPATSCDGSFS